MEKLTQGITYLYAKSCKNYPRLCFTTQLREVQRVHELYCCITQTFYLCCDYLFNEVPDGCPHRLKYSAQ